MEQVYTPNVLVKAIAGWCLKYVDDAGNAPNRTATARYAWEVERNAGRIRTDTIPENVWLVGWLDFTAGMYQTYGHVFLFKRTGNNYLIYDSEVQSGARKPYGSLQELLAWFGAYRPVYTGWSTHCDGREYAKKRSEAMTDAEALDVRNLLRVINSEAKGWPREEVHAGKYDKREMDYLVSLKKKPTLALQEYSQQAWNEGEAYRKKKDQWQKDSEVNLPAAKKEIEQLKKQLAEKPTGDFVKVTDLYIKKG